MGHLDKTISKLIRGSLTESSHVIYDRTINQFISFCKSLDSNFIGLPASVDHVLHFLAETFDNNTKYSSMSSKLCIISYYHKLYKLPDPTTEFIVKRAMQGFRKLAEMPKSKVPISIEMLEMLISKCDMLFLSAYCEKMLKAILSVGFFALLRPGEIVQSHNSIQLGDVFMQDKLLVIDFKKFKHSKNHPNCISVSKVTGACCPHLHLANYLQCRGSHPGDLFVLHKNKPLKYNMLVQWFSMLVNVARLPKCLSLHCLRVGGATHLALLGKSENQIRRSGRWSSRGFDAYLKFNSVSVL